MSPWLSLNDSDAHDKEPALKDLALFKLIWPYVKPEWVGLAGSMLLLPIISATQVIQPMLLKKALDGPVVHHDLMGLLSIGGEFALALAAHYGVRYAHMMLTQATGQRVVRRLRCALYDHLQGLSPRFYSSQPIGKLVSRISSDVENISEMFASGGVAILADFATIIGIFIAMLYVNVPLALIVLAVSPIVIGVMEFFRIQSRKAYNMLRVQLAKINSNLQETFSGIDVVQLLRRESYNLKQFDKVNIDYANTSIRSITFDSTFTASVEWMSYSTLVLVVAGFGWYATQGVPIQITQLTGIATGTLTLGVLVAFLQYVQMLFEPIEDLSDKFTIVQSGLASIDKLSELLHEQSDLVDPSEPMQLPAWVLGTPSGGITLTDVSYHYPNTEHNVLNHFNLSIQPGERVALIGPSGAGKSTIIRLLNRFHEPQSGSITLDGVPIQDLALSDLRHRIGVIPQDDFIFSRSVKDNIIMCPPNDRVPQTATDDAVLAVLERVHAKAMVEQLPQGIHTQLSERGRNLSAGERQLLMFARALWHNPSVLMLDEATSAIDPQTEATVQRAINEAFTDRTAIIVAHRLSTIQHVDRVIVIENGAITEEGPPAELYERNGRYRYYADYFFGQRDN